MGLFSSNRNYSNNDYTNQNNVDGHIHANSGNHANTINNGGPSFSSYDHDHVYGNSNGTTAGHGNFVRDHNPGLANQNPSIYATGDRSTVDYNRNGGLTSHNTNMTGNQGNFHRNDGGALGQDANVNTSGHQRLPHHDRNATVLDPNTNTNLNHNHIKQNGAGGYSGTSAYSNTGTGRGGWFSRNRNRTNDRSAHLKTGTRATAGGGWLSRNRGTNVPKSNKGSRSHSKSHQREKFDINSGWYNRRASFGQWIKFTWLDILTMVILSAIALGVNNAGPAPSRSFPVYFQDGQIVYPQFAYPVRDEIIPLWLSAFLALIIPIVVILCMQFRIRSFWDMNNAIVGLLYSLITAAVFQVFLKWLIGGLRPHFLSVCQPIIDNNGVELGNGLKQIYYDRSICSGNSDDIDEALESFPSGHATAAFAGFIFLYLYLNAKLKVFSNHHAAMWKLVVIYAPVLGATLIAGALTIDEYNNWYDVVAGAIIGTIMALSAYRMVYASVWDFRFNHIPLTRHTPFSYGAGEAGAGGFETAVFSRAAGWGFDEAYGGAPFDAAHNLRGTMAGFNHGVHDQNYGHHRSHTNGNTTNLATGHDQTEKTSMLGRHTNNADMLPHNIDTNNTGTYGRHTTSTHTYPNNLDSSNTGTFGQHPHNTHTLPSGVDSSNTGTFGRHTTTTHTHPHNIMTNNNGVADSGNRTSVVEPTTPTRGRFQHHHSSKSLERRPVGGGQAVQSVDHMA